MKNNKKEIMRRSLSKLSKFDLRCELAAKIIELLRDMQLDEEQLNRGLEDEELQTFVESTIQILSMTCVSFLKNLPFTKEESIEISKQFANNILENVIFKFKQDEGNEIHDM